MKKYRSLFVSLTIALLLSSCSPNSANPTADEIDTIVINNSTHISYAPIYLAKAYGYFNEFGIQLEGVSFNSVSDAVPLLTSGDLDVYAGSVGAGLFNIFRQDPNVKTVAHRGEIKSNSCTFMAVLVRKDLYESGQVTKPEDLKGLLGNYTPSSTTGFLLDSYLKPAGLTMADVEVSKLPDSSLLDALDNNAIDIIVTPEFDLTRYLQHGKVVMLAKAEDLVSPFQSSVLVFGKRLMKENPDLGIRFLAAYLKGVKKYNEGKTEENLKIISEESGEDIETLRQACWIYIPEDGLINFAAAVDPFQQWLISQDLLESPVTEEQFWDPSFLDKAFTLLEKEKK